MESRENSKDAQPVMQLKSQWQAPSVEPIVVGEATNTFLNPGNDGNGPASLS